MPRYIEAVNVRALAGTALVDVAAAPSSFLATDLEVLTLTPTSAVISWVTRTKLRVGRMIPQPVAAGTHLRFGALGGGMPVVHDDPTPRVWHILEITGLTPGVTYESEACSDGIVASGSLRPTTRASSIEARKRFTIPLPPPGEYLTTIALMNDSHIGEYRQGINLGPLPTSVLPLTDVEYSVHMLRSCLRDADERYGHPFVVINGDATNFNTEPQVRKLLSVMDEYGSAHKDWLITRGNHDCPMEHGDPFGEHVMAYQQCQEVTLDSGVRIVGMDSTKEFHGGHITNEQFDQIEQIYAADPDRPTLSLTHHPATFDAGKSAIAGHPFMLALDDQIKLQHIHRRSPGAFLHHSGHTHRARLDTADVPGVRTKYLETIATSAYPGGYTALHLFTGGFCVSARRPFTDEALEWLFASRWQMLGVGPHLMIGDTGDRNHTAVFDFSGITSDRSAPAEFAGL